MESFSVGTAGVVVTTCEKKITGEIIKKTNKYLSIFIPRY